MLAHALPADLLRLIMPAVLVAVALFFALKPGLSDDDRVERIKPAVFTFTTVPLIAAYDGFFGPGTGSFLIFLFIRFFGLDFMRASASAKVVNIATNLAALSFFVQLLEGGPSAG